MVSFAHLADVHDVYMREYIKHLMWLQVGSLTVLEFNDKVQGYRSRQATMTKRIETNRKA